MKLNLLVIFSCLCSSFLFGQNSLYQFIEKYNDDSVPYIRVEELRELKDVILLDTREKAEFEVSHIKGAQLAGYTSFDINSIVRKFPDKHTPVVVYCSIGVRSEDIGELLLEAGYTNVYNLYGGIFEWFSQNEPVYDSNNQTVDRIHGFHPRYGKWLNKGEKVYD